MKANRSPKYTYVRICFLVAFLFFLVFFYAPIFTASRDEEREKKCQTCTSLFGVIIAEFGTISIGYECAFAVGTGPDDVQ